ncbi:unnamed protein product [Didymodactylos carnosus]|uniref:Uncharacterized protein n=1 Tax=Didymodactylos carnosus TaxID=1234261 RepID=A0A816APS1_9BILA|nr:unnamed protein product [Didymodactylos carnosus]CAF4476400.1 unnamed protein product [Didymodactylos carnosus]
MALWLSRNKPNVDLFLHDLIEQIIELMKDGVIIFIGNREIQVSVKIGFFVSDLPAKSLFLKFINFNGYFACVQCHSEGEWIKRQVIYPYAKNDYTPRTHQQYIATAKRAAAKSSGGRSSAGIDGIKGLSSLIKVIEFPQQVILDFMHQICLNHVPNLIRRWNGQLNGTSKTDIDSTLAAIPHNVHVVYIHSISQINDWKAKHSRLFVNNIGLPVVVPHLPKIYSSPFAIYSMLSKMLHSEEEIKLAERLIHFYCRTAADIHDPTIELFSLHSQLHLPAQVRAHGGD